MDRRDGDGRRWPDRDVAAGGAPARRRLRGHARAGAACRAGGDAVMRRRDFLTRLAAGGVSVFAARELAAQEAAPPQGVNSNLFDMDQEAARRVVRPPKRDARPSMTDD